MARTIPSFPPELKGGCPDAHAHSTETLHTFDIEVITPLFGGGVEAGINDPITLIRPSSIRGHLRFWWRATRGATFSSAAEMRQCEEKIWGSTEEPSKVVVTVELVSKGEIKKVGSFEKQQDRQGNVKTDEHGYPIYSFQLYSGLPDYASFPFRPQFIKNKPLEENNELIKEVRKDIIFKLNLSYNRSELDLDDEIIPAITAWVNFGGIGARTRRGFGALYCGQLAIQDNDSLGKFFKSLNADKSRICDWPTLYQNYFLIAQTNNDNCSAWKVGISKLQSFRQLPEIGRRKGTDLTKPKKKHGRSNWPEAETVRNLVFAHHKDPIKPKSNRTNVSFPGWHKPDTDLSLPPSPPESAITESVYFPRAEFGLPIIFEIIGESLTYDERNRKKGPNLKPTLQYSDKHDRLASPLIIRPIKFKDGPVCILFLRLQTPPLMSAYLKPGQTNEIKTDLTDSVPIACNQIRNEALSTYPNSPLGPSTPDASPRSAKGSALDAFFAYLRKG